MAALYSDYYDLYAGRKNTGEFFYECSFRDCTFCGDTVSFYCFTILCCCICKAGGRWHFKGSRIDEKFYDCDLYGSYFKSNARKGVFRVWCYWYLVCMADWLDNSYGVICIVLSKWFVEQDGKFCLIRNGRMELLHFFGPHLHENVSPQQCVYNCYIYEVQPVWKQAVTGNIVWYCCCETADPVSYYIS